MAAGLGQALRLRDTHCLVAAGRSRASTRRSRQCRAISRGYLAPSHSSAGALSLKVPSNEACPGHLGSSHPVRPVVNAQLARPGAATQSSDNLDVASVRRAALPPSVLGALDIVIDEPRTYSAEEARAALLARVSQLESMLRAVDSEPSGFPPVVVAQWRHGIELLQAAADLVGRGGTRDRATLLDLCFSIPGTWWFGPVEILTDDLAPEWLGVMLGFAFDRRGLLSVRDRKLLGNVSTAVFDHWQSTRYPDREVSPETSRRVVSRLATVRRLLQPSSLFAYVAQLTRRRYR